MKVLLTVVVGYIDGSGSLRTSCTTEEIEIQGETSVVDVIKSKVDEYRTTFPNRRYKGLHNVLSVSHCVLP